MISSDTEAICDFCSRESVVRIRTLGPAKARFFDGFPVDIATDGAPALAHSRIRQHWYTCQQCEALVQAQDRIGLLQRASDDFARAGGENARIADFSLALMQSSFWAMLDGKSKFSVLDYVASPVRTAFKALAGSERRNFRLPSGNLGVERWFPNETAIHVGLRRDSLWLITIRAKTPGHGRGSDTIRSITAIADEDKTAIELRAQPYGPPEWRRLDEAALVRWYARFGFQPFHEGSTDDDAGTWMRRDPAP